MEFKEIKELIEQISNSNLAEFKFDNGDVVLSIRTKHYTGTKAPVQVTAAQPMMQMAAPAAAPTPQATPPPASAEVETPRDPIEGDNYIQVRSPIVGTFYRSSAPDKPPFVKVGDSISKGSVVCIVEAMKLFNEIESEVSGRIVKVLVDDASPVEYDQALYIVDPNG